METDYFEVLKNLREAISRYIMHNGYMLANKYMISTKFLDKKGKAIFVKIQKRESTMTYRVSSK